MNWLDFFCVACVHSPIKCLNRHKAKYFIAETDICTHMPQFSEYVKHFVASMQNYCKSKF
ncbi:unnamed protein product [Acanthoscelides obtectus]|uniref:Uncharacterized protein n=1 Tax=Acanthoscelides obtectus TaxID=200917 RepID=A0A9P0PTY9_ACAOB|nr:unnamed protein product [Acanthoscelides obtectus]CAK1650244.1 hypothetical protein AOBTE_LOCUS16713 [Acanthoscelides obtectus]